MIVAAVLQAIDDAVASYAEKVATNLPLRPDSPLAKALGTKLPIVQGPMSRVSDTLPFAKAIADGGALPMIAFAMLRGEKITELLENAKESLAGKPWGIGLLGFVSPALLEEQISAALSFKPGFAIIAGGRPDQAVALEAQGISSFLHLPSASLLSGFLKGGARRFIFEGRECGGHIGPLSSFVLWSTMIDRLLTELDTTGIPGEDIQCLFAGGIHDAYSSALLQVMTAPLAERDVKIGIIMGSAYLFTKEIVETGGIVDTFQKVVVECEKTVTLETGTGHASRCAYTPFAQSFFKTRKNYKTQVSLSANNIREKLDDLILGTLRLASKGVTREDGKDALVTIAPNKQRKNGMYMLGQVALLRNNIITIDDLHNEVINGAQKILNTAATQQITKDKEIKTPADIAIVGISCALPGARDIETYWENILNKVNSITEVPRHRWDSRLYFDPDRNAKDKVYSKWGGFLDDIPFDPSKYGITPKSIVSIDPIQLMALEVAQAALADSGYRHTEKERERTSVIIGASGGTGDVGSQYCLRSEFPRFAGELPTDVAGKLPEWSEDTFAGILINVVAGRIANRLDFGGTNFTTDAACASSMAAIRQGVQELLSKNSDTVIVGGVDTVQGPFGYMCFSKTQALSPTGICSTFDKDADGIVISEGIGMLVLKRLEDAERDGNRIYAVIKGVGTGSDGKGKGLSAPLPEGQLRAMRRAYKQAGFLPDTVRLFEAHGTGTVAGDTAELQSTSMLLKKEGSKPHRAVIGSVKTMIGHTKATAGVAGIIKAVLALHHKVLPPHYGVKNPSPALTDKNPPLYLLDKAEPWLSTADHPRRAAASAFGFGGTNFHVVMEEYQDEYRAWKRTAPRSQWFAEIFIFSGKDKPELQKQLGKIKNILQQTPDIELRDLAYAFAKSWDGKGETVFIVAENFEKLTTYIDAVMDYLEGKKTLLPTGVYHSDTQTKGKLAVLFPGQGSQYTSMAREVFLQFSVCADILSDAEQLLAQPFSKRFGENIRLGDFIFPRGTYNQQAKNEATRALANTDIAQPALGAIEAGLWRLMCAFGLKTDMLAGHSYGEFVALYAGGFLNFNDLIKISEARGRLIVDKARQAGTESGAMSAVKASREEVESAINGIKDVVIANHNSPKQIVISGSMQAIKKASEILSQSGKTVIPLPVAAAFHSSFVEPARSSLAEVINKADWKHESNIPVYSNNTAKTHDALQIKKAMTDHLVKPVEFVAEIEAMYKDGARVFLELGPKPVLTRLVGGILGNRPHTAIAFDDKGGGLTGMLYAFAQLLSAGIEIDVRKLFEGRDCLTIDLENITAAHRHPRMPKHAWLLNGSGVRRATDPIKQIGITLEQAKERKIPQASNTPIKNEGKKVMDDNDIKPGSAVAEAYFRLLERQLDNAREVALAALGKAPAKSIRPRQPLSLPEPVALPIREKAAPKLAPVAAPPARTVKQKPPSIISSKEKTEGINEKKLKEIILSVVTEKTGYEADMIEFDQNLEADLGIDSIKRVDIVGGILEQLPESFAQTLGTDGRTKLRVAATLDKILTLLLEAGGNAETEGKAVNFNQAGTGFKMADTNVRHLSRLSQSRFEIIATAEPLDASDLKNLTTGDFIVVKDASGVADHFSKLLTEKGCTVYAIEPKILKNETALLAWCELVDKKVRSLAGIAHLASLDTSILDPKASAKEWKEQLFTNEKSLFILLRHFSDRLEKRAHILSASALGGTFSRKASQVTGLSLQGGAVGMIKSLCKERENLRGKTVDLDTSINAETLATQLFTELTLEGGRIEVGYPKGNRTVFKTRLAPIDAPSAINQTGMVILATGGARGVTAETLREFAKPENTLILMGRSRLPSSKETLRKDPEASLLTTEKELVRYFVKIKALSISEARSRTASVLAAREMLDNISDFQSTGATVEYCTADVTDENAVSSLLKNFYTKYGRIDGVVHGAGIIEDKFLADITPESWSRVVNVKVLGLLALQKNIRTETLRFFTVFSSVAGRYGNSGQSHYATANELINRLCCQLQQKWGDGVNVSALCWGPWGKTKFGSGMVTPETEEKFVQQGVFLVTAETGKSLFNHQVMQGGSVEVICGAGPWEQHEAEKGRIKKATGNTATLLNPSDISPDEETSINITLGKNHLYLQDHIIDELPVLPMAVAIEMMVQAVSRKFGSDWRVAEILNCQLFKGVIVDREDYLLTIKLESNNDAKNPEVKAKIFSNGDKPVPHYGATIILTKKLSVLEKALPKTGKTTKPPVTAKEAYTQWLFHGPRFHIIKSIDSFSEESVCCEVRSTSPKDFLNGCQTGDQWLIDPALIDAAAQISVLWMALQRDLFALPVRIGRIVRYAEMLPQILRISYIIRERNEETLVVDVYFHDDDGRTLLLIEGMQHIGSKTRKIGLKPRQQATG